MLQISIEVPRRRCIHKILIDLLKTLLHTRNNASYTVDTLRCVKDMTAEHVVAHFFKEKMYHISLVCPTVTQSRKLCKGNGLRVHPDDHKTKHVEPGFEEIS